LNIRGFILSVLVAALSCGSAAAQQGGGGKTIVYTTARSTHPVYIADSSAVVQVGNVVAYHNGAVITCDSLIQYSGQHIECFGNVIVNKDSTYVYGDRLDYDGDRSIAQVFSPLVKMIDGDAVLYTYNFLFNTLDNVGEYYGGGTITRGETLLESDRGFYYSDSRDVICVGDVELRDSTYQIISDSLGYNMDSEVATFYSQSYIWNEKGEILSADKGWYYTKEERDRFISNAYVLTEDQEIWADDIDYRAEVEDIVMRRNIQIRDEEQKTIGFGDYGLYFGQSGNAMLTEMPSLINFDEENGDSVYMRADSIFMYVLDSTSVYSSEYVGREEETTALDGSLIGEETLITSPGLQ
jgi:lipopolysaccharide assembly outer membrane protein LptD (OstA)